MLVSAVWIAPAILATIDQVAQRRLHGDPPANAQDLIWAGGDWLVYALLTPPIFAAARRWPIARPHVAARAVLHLGFSLLFCVAWATSGKVLQLLLGLLFKRSEVEGMIKAAGDQFWQKLGLDLLSWIFTTMPFGVVVYLSIVGIAHAAFYHSEAQQRALHEAQLETRLVESQLQMLQHQLHPHFLFNTLHAISALMHRDVQAADRMLSRLSDLLRLTLDSVTRPEIRLFEEMEFLEKYASIEQVRMGDRLAIEFDVDADVLDAAVPALVLQPLVENAIKHGIAPSGRPGRVAIGARRDGEMLIMTVDDTGSGPNERAMAALSTGIGVSNTRARLTHQFGSRYRFEFQRHPNGFTVLVGIPYRQEPAAISIAEFVA